MPASAQYSTKAARKRRSERIGGRIVDHPAARSGPEAQLPPPPPLLLEPPEGDDLLPEEPLPELRPEPPVLLAEPLGRLPAEPELALGAAPEDRGAGWLRTLGVGEVPRGAGVAWTPGARCTLRGEPKLGEGVGCPIDVRGVGWLRMVGAGANARGDGVAETPGVRSTLRGVP